MKRLTLAATLCAVTLPTLPASAEGFVMGAGRWTCERARAAFITDNASDKAQVAGWLLGYWSAETFDKPLPFIEKVQEVGGQKVVELTLVECQKNPNALLYQVSAAILANSLAEETEAEPEGETAPASE